jgi:hypothetical protein
MFEFHCQPRQFKFATKIAILDFNRAGRQIRACAALCFHFAPEAEAEAASAGGARRTKSRHDSLKGTGAYFAPIIVEKK